MQLITSAVAMARFLLLQKCPQAKVLVDATAGNGNDTLLLAEHMPEEAKLYAFDIQPLAIAATKEKTAAYAGKITYVLDSHERIDQWVPEEIDAAIFNLGYLPGGNHQVTTEAVSTRRAVEIVLQKLSLQGVLVVVVYPGHPEGKNESELLGEYLKTLPCEAFTVGCYKMVNHTDIAPFLYTIEKVRG